MIELTFIVLLNRIIDWGLRPIIVTRVIAADGPALHALLSNAANHWRLTAGFARVVALQGEGNRCDARLRFPFGVRVPASMEVTPGRKGRLLTCEIGLAGRTVAHATWILSPDRGTTEVDLAIQLESRSILTRMVLVLGGRRWIARRLETALATLGITSLRVAEDVDAAPAATPVRTTPEPSRTTRLQAA